MNDKTESNYSIPLNIYGNTESYKPFPNLTNSDENLEADRPTLNDFLSVNGLAKTDSDQLLISSIVSYPRPNYSNHLALMKILMNNDKKPIIVSPEIENLHVRLKEFSKSLNIGLTLVDSLTFPNDARCGMYSDGRDHLEMLSVDYEGESMESKPTIRQTKKRGFEKSTFNKKQKYHLSPLLKGLLKTTIED